MTSEAETGRNCTASKDGHIGNAGGRIKVGIFRTRQRSFRMVDGGRCTANQVRRIQVELSNAVGLSEMDTEGSQLGAGSADDGTWAAAFDQ